MPKNIPPTPPRNPIPEPHRLVHDELKRTGQEVALRVLDACTSLVVFVRQNPDRIHESDVALAREARRDVEHARIVLEGLARRWRVELKSSEKLETVTLEEAKRRHPGCVIEIIERADVGGEPREAIYVWETEDVAESDDGARARAIYWLAEGGDE